MPRQPRSCPEPSSAPSALAVALATAAAPATNALGALRAALGATALRLPRSTRTTLGVVRSFCTRPLSRLLAQPLPRLATMREAHCAWWAREDLNLRPHAYQARALTN